MIKSIDQLFCTLLNWVHWKDLWQFLSSIARARSRSGFLLCRLELLLFRISKLNLQKLFQKNYWKLACGLKLISQTQQLNIKFEIRSCRKFLTQSQLGIKKLRKKLWLCAGAMEKLGLEFLLRILLRR